MTNYDFVIQKFITIIGIVSLILLWYNASWIFILLSYFYYKIVVGLIGNQIAQHRYFSHRSFKTSNIKQWVLYLSSLTTGINPINYAIAHRHHHAFSDTNNDIHSVHKKWFDIFSPVTHHVVPKNIKISRVIDHVFQRKINKFWWVLFFVYSLMFGIIHWTWIIYFAFAGVGWNYVHMILFRVWLVHTKLPGSYRNFNTLDKSWNNKWLQLLDLGEGLHNNHHQFPNKYNQAVMLGEFDFAGWTVKHLFNTNKVTE